MTSPRWPFGELHWGDPDAVVHLVGVHTDTYVKTWCMKRIVTAPRRRQHYTTTEDPVNCLVCTSKALEDS